MVLLRAYKETAHEIDSFGLQSLAINGLFYEQKITPSSPTKKEQVGHGVPVPSAPVAVPIDPSRVKRNEHVYLIPANPNPEKGRCIDPKKVCQFLVIRSSSGGINSPLPRQPLMKRQLFIFMRCTLTEHSNRKQETLL